MIEFFAGFILALACVGGFKFSQWLTTQDYKALKILESNDFDFNEIEKDWQKVIDSPFDPENYFKPEGTK